MFRYNFATVTIKSAGYDAQKEVLEVEFTSDGQIWQYIEVPEDIWYRFKREAFPDIFFQRFIKGCYVEKRISIG